MKWIDFLKSVFSRKGPANFLDDDLLSFMEDTTKQIAIRETAYHAAVNLIIRAASKCEFLTYASGKPHQGEEYYLWNVSANHNESAKQFRAKLLYKLFHENECLVVFVGGQAFVADSFSKEKDWTLYPDTFGGVTVGSYTFEQSFSAQDVLYYQLNQCNVRLLLDQINALYEKLITVSQKAFTRTRGERGVLSVQTMVGRGIDSKELHEFVNTWFKPYFNSDNVVLPLPEGYTYNRGSSSSFKEVTDASDTRKLIYDILDLTAISLQIPPALLRGEIVEIEQNTNNFLTFCIAPLMEDIACEINRKRFSKSEYLGGTFLRIDTSNIKHRDLLDCATSFDKLIASGFSFNDLCPYVGKAPIPEPWADEHHITKNYQKVDFSVEGGEKNNASSENEI